MSNGQEVIAQVKAKVGGTHSTAYLHSSRMGTVSVVEEGSTVTEITQDAFGMPIAAAGSGVNAWSSPTTVGFGGHEMEADLELVNMSGRIYDPASRQFLTPDPIVSRPFSVVDLHPYAFAWSNPLRYADPSGLDEVDDIIDSGHAAYSSSFNFEVEHVVGHPDPLNALTSPLGADGFAEHPSFGNVPIPLSDQIGNAAWFGAGVSGGIVVGTALANAAAPYIAAAAVSNPVGLTFVASVGATMAVQSYDFDALTNWYSRLYGNELSSMELLSGGFVVGTGLSGFGGMGSRAAVVIEEVAAGLPQITAGTNREMLGQAVNHVQSLAGTAAEKAALFENLAPQITELSGRTWSTARSLGADGSHIFTGGLGETLVVSPSGQLFRGSLAQAGNFTIGPTGVLQPVYQALRAIGGTP